MQHNHWDIHRVELMRLATRIADDLDAIAGRPATELGCVRISAGGEDIGDPRVQWWPYPAEVVAQIHGRIPAATTWLRETLPTLIDEMKDSDGINTKADYDDLRDHLSPEDIESVLESNLVAAGQSSYRRPADEQLYTRTDSDWDRSDYRIHRLGRSAANLFLDAWNEFIERQVTDSDLIGKQIDAAWRFLGA